MRRLYFFYSILAVLLCAYLVIDRHWGAGCSRISEPRVAVAQRSGEVCCLHLCSLSLAEEASRTGFLHFCFDDTIFFIPIVILV